MLLRSEVEILLQSWARLQVLETMHSSQCSCDTVRVRTTQVEQFHFSCPLAKHNTRKEMFKKVDSFTRHHQLSRTHSVSVCADGAYPAMIKIKKTS